MKFKHIVLLVILLMTGSVWAAIPEKPNPARWINDYAGCLSPAFAEAMNARLQALSDSTTNQIVVVTVADLEGYAPVDYAQQLGQAWGVGSKRYNNGVVLLIKPRNEQGAGQVFLATGYGIEGAVTDVQAAYILDVYVVPRLAEGDYDGAVQGAVDQLVPRMVGEYNESWLSEPSDNGGGWQVILVVVGGILGAYWLAKPSKKQLALRAVEYAMTPQERDGAIVHAQSLNIAESKIQRAEGKIPNHMLKVLRTAADLSSFDQMVPNAIAMGVKAGDIQTLRAAMRDYSLQDLRDCRRSAQLESLQARARAFGNDEEAIRNAMAIAMAAMAAAAVARAASRSSSSYRGGFGGGSSHSGFGGGSFGGGGAGRRF